MSQRVTEANRGEVRADGEFVLYWMIAFRRLASNAALDRAAGWARRLGRPLVILEALRCGHRWASERTHRFVLDGMAEHARALAGSPVTYYPYVEPEPGAGRGLLAALAERAAVVVADDFPSFFLPRMVAAAAGRVGVRMEAVDANGLLPVRAAGRDYPTAYAFRRYLQKSLPAHLAEIPADDPLAAPLPARLKALPREALRRWPPASREALAGETLASLPIDHAVAPVAGTAGGEAAAQSVLQRFVAQRLARYGEDRNDPSEPAASGLSPYLHFGFVSAHQVLAAVAEHEGWSPERLASKTSGKREGWWGMSAGAEKFLDEAVTWRELGLNAAASLPGWERYESLPAWALATLERHAKDPRPAVYDLAQLEAGATHDPLWNAAQAELRQSGRIHNYLRMLWGKKVLHWTRSPREALEILVELNNKWALDGRNPNSYTGIFWCLGRYDRPWPERAVFGTVRYMSSESTRRKYRVESYIARWTR